MAVFQVKWFLKVEPECAGFSIDWYVNASTHEEAAAKTEKARDVYVSRQPTQVVLTHARVSNVEIPGDALVSSTWNRRGSNGSQAEVADEGVLVRWRLGEGAFANQIIRCVADDEVMREAGPQAYTLTPEGFRNWTSFFDAVIESNLMRRYNVRADDANNRNITKIQYNDTTKQFLLTVPRSGWEIGDRIFIHGKLAKLYPTLRGERVIANIINDVVYINALIPCDQKEYIGGLKAYKREWVYAEPTTYVIRGIASRKPGRPFGLRAGKSKPGPSKVQCLPAVVVLT